MQVNPPVHIDFRCTIGAHCTIDFHCAIDFPSITAEALRELSATETGNVYHWNVSTWLIGTYTILQFWGVDGSDYVVFMAATKPQRGFGLTSKSSFT